MIMEKFTIQYLKDLVINYWVDSLQNSLKEEYNDNGDGEPNKTQQELIKFIKSGIQITKEQIIQFKKELTELIENYYCNGKFRPLYLANDYNPCEELFDICKKLNIDKQLLPWKSFTFLNYNSEYNTNCLSLRFGQNSKPNCYWENQKCVLNSITGKFEGVGNLYYKYYNKGVLFATETYLTDVIVSEFHKHKNMEFSENDLTHKILIFEPILVK